MNSARLITDKKGFSLIETLLAITIFAIISIGVFHTAMEVMQRDAKIELQSMATAYAQEGIEAMRNIRDRNYLLVTNGDHGLGRENGAWVRIPAPENIDDFFYRTIVVSDVFRDENGNIAENGTFDADTKRIVSTVEWNWRGFLPQSVSLKTYLSNWPGQDLIQTDCEELEQGEYEATTKEEIEGPPQENCGIKLDIEEEESTFFASTDIGNHARDVYLDGNIAYVANNSSREGVTAIDVTDRDNPVVLDGMDVGKKGLALKKDGNYLYVAVEDRRNGLAILNVSNPSNMSIVSQLNFGEYGGKMDIKDDYLYISSNDRRGESLKIIDISDKSNPEIVNEMGFDSVVSAINIRGNYAYIGLDRDINSFNVFDVSDPANPLHIAELDVGEQVNNIELNGFHAFVGIEDTGESLKVINIADPENPSLVTSLDAGAEIEALSSHGNYLYVALDDQNAGMGAINIANPTVPYLVYNYDVTGKGTGIAADSTHVFVTTGTNNRGLVITGTTIVEFNAFGEYISPVFDTGSHDTRYNYIDWDQIEIQGGSVKFQLRTASTSGGVSSANWVGPDGTQSIYYEIPRTIIQTEPGAGLRYFQYKAILESDGIGTPTLDSVTVNYTK